MDPADIWWPLLRVVSLATFVLLALTESFSLIPAAMAAFAGAALIGRWEGSETRSGRDRTD